MTEEAMSVGAIASGSEGTTEAVDTTTVSTEEGAIRKDAPDTTKHKLSIDGEDVEMTLEEMKKAAQKVRAADKRFQEAASMRKANESREQTISEIEGALEKGNLKFIEGKVGKAKAKQLMEEYLIQDMEYEELPESEKKARELQKRIDAYEEREKEAKEKQDKVEKDKILQKAHGDLDKEVGDALRAIGKKPTPKLAVRVVDEMIHRLSAGKDPISAGDAVKYAEKGILADIGEYLPQLSNDELLATIPPEVLKRIRQIEVDKVIGERGTRRVKVDGDGITRKPKETLSVDEWFKKQQA